MIEENDKHFVISDIFDDFSTHLLNSRGVVMSTDKTQCVYHRQTELGGRVANRYRKHGAVHVAQLKRVVLSSHLSLIFLFPDDACSDDKAIFKSKIKKPIEEDEV